MKKKVAIIDSLGAHGSSHHYYLFGQADGLINAGINVVAGVDVWDKAIGSYSGKTK